MILIPFISVGAGSVNLVWNASPDAEVAGYNVYYGTASQSYSSMIPVGNECDQHDFRFGRGSTYYFAVTAVDATGIESDFSNETSSSVPGGNQAPTISGHCEPDRNYESDHPRRSGLRSGTRKRLQET